MRSLLLATVFAGVVGLAASASVQRTFVYTPNDIRTEILGELRTVSIPVTTVIIVHGSAAPEMDQGPMESLTFWVRPPDGGDAKVLGASIAGHSIELALVGTNGDGEYQVTAAVPKSRAEDAKVNVLWSGTKVGFVETQTSLEGVIAPAQASPVATISKVHQHR